MARLDVSPDSSLAPLPHIPHTGERAVRAGPYELYASGTMYDMCIAPGTVLVALTAPSKTMHYDDGSYIWLLLEDFGGVPDDWALRLEEAVIPELASGQRLLAFCAGSHGRTGTFLASLIALLESPEETPDPIAAVRARHCKEAVETLAQAEAIFALRNQDLPAHYRRSVHF